MVYYAWKRGYHARIDATTFGVEYEKIRAQHGEVSADILVEAATSTESPIHHGFTWDDKQTGHLWRLQEARHLMASILVVDEAIDAPPTPTRYLIAVKPLQDPDSPGKVYIPLADAMRDPERRQEVLTQALRELRAIQTKYHALTELSAIFEAIDRTAGQPAHTEG
jgi:hypothetical protein